MDELTKRQLDRTVKPAALPLIVASGLPVCMYHGCCISNGGFIYGSEDCLTAGVFFYNSSSVVGLHTHTFTEQRMQLLGSHVVETPHGVSDAHWNRKSAIASETFNLHEE